MRRRVHEQAWFEVYTHYCCLETEGQEVDSEILAGLLDNCPISFDKVG